MFCNNCGKQGHLYHRCKKPISSLGIIAFRKGLNKEYEYFKLRIIVQFGLTFELNLIFLSNLSKYD